MSVTAFFYLICFIGVNCLGAVLLLDIFSQFFPAFETLVKIVHLETFLDQQLGGIPAAAATLAIDGYRLFRFSSSSALAENFSSSTLILMLPGM